MAKNAIALLINKEEKADNRAGVVFVDGEKEAVASAGGAVAWEKSNNNVALLVVPSKKMVATWAC